MRIQEELWQEGISSEISFWEEWMQNKGLYWPEEFNERIDPETPLQSHLIKYLPNDRKFIDILDVGAGPLTCLGKKTPYPDVTLRITCTDPLADHYLKLLKKYDINPLTSLLKAKSEELSRHLPDNYFDIVYMRNALDHSYDPLAALSEMMKVVVNNGYILLEHLYNEAENEKYQGFHQWNIFVENDQFIIWNKTTRYNITEFFTDKAIVICHDTGKFNFIEMKKIS